jgi:predicted secreted protein
MTSFQLQTSLTTQIMEFTNETRTAIVVAAYRAARVAGVDTTTEMTLPVLQSMLQEQIDLFVEENPELFDSETEAEEFDDELSERTAEFYRNNASVFASK